MSLSHVYAIALAMMLFDIPGPDPACRQWMDKTYAGEIIGIQRFDNISAMVTIRFTDGSRGFIRTTWEGIRQHSIRIGVPVQCAVDRVRSSCAERRRVLACSVREKQAGY